MSKHTPTPYKYRYSGDGCYEIVGNDECSVCDCTPMNQSPADETRLNAEFIVRACNAHDELLAACNNMLAVYRDCDTVFKKRGVFIDGEPDAFVDAEAAIAKAE